MGTSLNGLTPAGTYPGLIKTGDNAPIDGTLKTLSDGNGNNLPMSVSTTAVNFTNQLQQGGVAVPTASQVNAKQDTLVSGTNIKTVNSTSLLGSGNVAVQDVLVSGTNIKTINGTSVLGSGNIVTPSTPPSGVAGAIQFSNGSAFASDAANLFWDDTNDRLGIGTNAPSARITAQTTSAADGIVLRDATNQLAVIGKWFDSSGFFDLSINGTPYARIQASQSYINTPITFGSASALSARVGIKGSGTTSGTTSLLVQNSAGTELFKVQDNGVMTTSSSINCGLNMTIATGGSYLIGTRGQLGASSNGVWVLYDSSQSSFNRLQFGGTTASYPSIKRASNNIEIKNADDTFGAGLSVGASLNASAILQADSTTQGFLPPRMTTTQKNAIATPASGLQVYDTTLNQMSYYNGSSWVNF